MTAANFKDRCMFKNFEHFVSNAKASPGKMKLATPLN